MTSYGLFGMSILPTVAGSAPNFTRCFELRFSPFTVPKHTISSIGTAARDLSHNRGLGHELGLEQVPKNTYFGVGNGGKRIT